MKIIFRSLARVSVEGESITLLNGETFRMFPAILILSADYEEQYVLTLHTFSC